MVFGLVGRGRTLVWMIAVYLWERKRKKIKEKKV